MLAQVGRLDLKDRQLIHATLGAALPALEALSMLSLERHCRSFDR
jgi:hypothetical protein